MSDQPAGPIRWFASNPVAANLVMIILLLGGLFMAFTIKQEVFPDFRLDMVRVSVPYPGASPSEIEQGIVIAVEEAVRGVDGVDRVTSAALEGRGEIYVSLELEADPTIVLADVKNEVDRLTSLPEDAERPTVALVTNRFEVVSLVFYGDVEVDVLRPLVEGVRDELLADPGITHAELAGAPRREIAIEVPQSKLREHGLTLEDVSARIAATSLELPGGTLKTSGGEILLRTRERRTSAAGYETVPILTGSTGTKVTLGDIATVREEFEDTDESAFYDGKPAIMLHVFRTGTETPLDVAARVEEHLSRLHETLPPGVEVAKWLDWSEIYWQRIELLMRNAAIGLVLVLLILGLFLELRLAFWVTMGIPVSFLGALLFMPTLDVTVNMISLFAFIVVLGMVVDDAIVVGENIFELRERGESRLSAAIKGARGVATPVCFAIATSVVAFLPMAFVPGFSGKLYRVIPAIVITVLVISLVESLWVLPAHLAAIRDPRATGAYAAVHRQQQKVKRALERFIAGPYARALSWVLRWRGASLATGIAVLLGAGGFVAGGHIPFRFMPDIAGDVVIASVEMPVGTPVQETQRIQAHLLAVAEEILTENGEEGIVRGTFGQVGTPLPGDPGLAQATLPGGHLANVQIFFVESGQRRIDTSDFLDKWRDRVGWVAGAERIEFQASIGPSPGPPVNVELRHDDMEVLEAAAADLATILRDYPEVMEIDDGFAAGKPQLDLELTPEATSLGLTSADVARQIRGAFYGTEALRQQIGRDEVRVLVRLPTQERKTIHDVETLLLRTPAGGEIPVHEAATVRSGRAYPVIKRAEGSRMLEVTADVRPGISPAVVLAALEEGPLPALLAEYDGLSYEFGGAQREQSKAWAA
jgi:multidrug efflux pump subunit AcrB